MIEEKNEEQERAWAMGAHLAGLAGIVGVPFGNILGPLFIWIIKRKEFPLVDQEAKSALNFQISLTLYAVIAAFFIYLYVGFFILIALMIFDLIWIIKAAIKVNNKETFRYPLTIRFIS